MALAFHGAQTALTGNNVSSGTWTLPAAPGGGYNSTYLAIFWLHARVGLYEINDPTGVTTKYTASHTTYGRPYIGYRWLQSGDTTFDWTRAVGSSGADVIWGVDVFSGGEGSGDPFAANSGAVTWDNAVSPNPPAVTPPDADSLIWTFWGKNDDFTGTPTAPTNYTRAASGSSTAGSDASAGTAYRILSGGGGVSQDPGAWSLSGGASTNDGVMWTGAVSPSAAATTANAGHASGTGSANNAVVAIVLAAQIASGVGAAHNAEAGEPLVQPSPWAPSVSFSTEVVADGQSLWTSIVRALPVWDTNAGLSYADDGTATDYDSGGTVTVASEPSGEDYGDFASDLLDLGTYDPATTGSVFLRFKADTLPSVARFFGFADGFEARGDSAGSLYNDLFKSGTTSASSSAITVGAYYNLIFTWDLGGDVGKIYLDGDEVLSQTGLSDPGSGTLGLGARTGTTDYIDGRLSAFYVWDRVLTATERGHLNDDPWILFRRGLVIAPAGHAAGTGAANNAAADLDASASSAAGTGAAADATASLSTGTEAATGTGTVGASGAAIVVNSGHAAATGTAHDATATPTTIADAAGASGTGTAHDATVTVAEFTTADAETATGTGAAADAATSVVTAAEAASGTGEAFGPTVTELVSAEAAAGTGTAHDGAASIAPAPHAAAATGTAHDATVSVAGNVVADAEAATGVGSAGSPASGVGASPQAADGLAEAFDATVSTAAGVVADAGHATGTGAAQDAAVSLSLEPQLATATGAAHNASVPAVVGLGNVSLSAVLRHGVTTSAVRIGGLSPTVTQVGGAAVASNGQGGGVTVSSALVGSVEVEHG